jgi:hypothetical protein
VKNIATYSFLIPLLVLCAWPFGGLWADPESMNAVSGKKTGSGWIRKEPAESPSPENSGKGKKFPTGWLKTPALPKVADDGGKAQLDSEGADPDSRMKTEANALVDAPKTPEKADNSFAESRDPEEAEEIEKSGESEESEEGETSGDSQEAKESQESPPDEEPESGNSLPYGGLKLEKPGDWEPFVEMDNQLFPSYLLSTAVLKTDQSEPQDPQLIGDRFGMGGIGILNPGQDTKIRLEIKENMVMEGTRFDAVLPKKDEAYFVYPPISFRFDALKNQRQPLPLNVSFSVSLNGGEPVTKVKTVLIRSINDCPTGYSNLADDSFQDISFMFAAYVNESHPMIDVILKEALKTKIVSSFSGYQYGEADEVYDQVYAIWTALQKRGIKYSSITTPSAYSDLVSSQNIRFIEESLENAQANCVDGSVLMASILYKIGINPFLVVLPDHLFLGFYLDEKNEYFACIETNLLSEGKGRKFFDQMLADSLVEFQKHEDKFLKDDDPDYQVIDIPAAREMGIVPIAFSR